MMKIRECIDRLLDVYQQYGDLEVAVWADRSQSTELAGEVTVGDLTEGYFIPEENFEHELAEGYDDLKVNTVEISG
jgi:hypothetical protein